MLKNIRNSLNKNTDIVYILCFSVYLLLITALGKEWIINNEFKNQLFWWFIYWYIIINILFNTGKVEYFFVKYMTPILFTSILFIAYYQHQLLGKNSNNELFIIIWWVFAFWYWYKKYERDKELQNLEHLSTDIYELDILEQSGKLELLYNYSNSGLLSKNIWNYIEKNFWNSILDNINLYIKSRISQEENDHFKIWDSLDILKEKIKLFKENWDISNENINIIEQEIILLKIKQKNLDRKLKQAQKDINLKLTKWLVELFRSDNINYINYLKMKLNQIEILQVEILQLIWLLML